MTETRKMQLKELFPKFFHEIIDKEITLPYATERNFQYFQDVEDQQHALLIHRTNSGTWVFDFNFYEGNEIIYSIRNEPFVAGTEVVIDVMCYAAGIIPKVGTKVRLIGSMTKFPEKNGQIVYSINKITSAIKLFVINNKQMRLPTASWTDYNDQFGRNGSLCPRLQPFFNGMSPRKIYARVEPIFGTPYDKHELGVNLEDISKMKQGQYSFCLDSEIYYDNTMTKEEVESIIVIITVDGFGNTNIDEINTINEDMSDDSKVKAYNLISTQSFKMLHKID